VRPQATSGPTVEVHTGFVACLEPCCATDELGESSRWSVKYDLMEEGYMQQVREQETERVGGGGRRRSRRDRGD
jgi:hypothetical protein